MPGIGIGISPLLKRKRAGGGSTPTSTNAIVQAWLNKVGADGYTYPAQAQVNIYTTAWDYADAQGLTTKFDLVGLLKVPNQNLCKIPFIHSAGSATRFTLVGTNLIFTANAGIKTSNADSYINTNWAEAPNGIHYQLNNGCFGVYMTQTMTTTQQDAIGASNSDLGTESTIVPFGGGVITADIQTFDAFGGQSTASGQGLTTIAVTSGTTNVYKNASINDTFDSSSATLTLNTLPYFVLGANLDGSTDPGAPCTSNVGFFFTSLGTIDQAKLNTFVNMLLL